MPYISFLIMLNFLCHYSFNFLLYLAQVLGGFDASNYVTERKWANAQDGTQIPISIVYHKDLVKLDGSDPLLLGGYGSYEVIKDFIIKL